MDDCPICLEPGADSTLSCTHRFHADCASSWLTINSTCPVCRAPAREVSTSILLALARNPDLFGIRRSSRVTATLRRSFPPSGGSLYGAAVECALRARFIADVASPEFVEEVTFMLVYLHLFGDSRAAVAAAQPLDTAAAAIADGIAKWAERAAAPRGSPRVRRRRFCAIMAV